MVDDTAAWERLCRLLDDDEHLWPTVRDALLEGADPWDALIGGLDDAGALAYLDAEDTGMELADALAQLPRVFRLQPDLGAVNDTDELDAALRSADATLAAADFRLLLLDDGDEDAFALVVVPAEHAGQAVGLADELERRITTFGGEG